MKCKKCGGSGDLFMDEKGNKYNAVRVIKRKMDLKKLRIVCCPRCYGYEWEEL